MTNELLLDVMGEIDSDLLERAEAPVPVHRKPVFRVALLVAAVSLLLACSLVLTTAFSTVRYVKITYPEYDGTVLHLTEILLTEDKNVVSLMLGEEIRQVLGGLFAALRGGSETPEPGTEPGVEIPEDITDQSDWERTDEEGPETIPEPEPTDDQTTEPEPEPTEEEITDEMPEQGWSQGLAYTAQEREGKKVYVVSGIGACADTEIYVPPTYQDCRVVGIGENAFENKKDIVLIALPSTIREIGDSAFRGCENLQAVTLNQGLERIGNWTFANTKSLEIILLPDSLAEIGDHAFYDSALTQIILPDSVKTVGSHAFSYCAKLERAVLSKGMRAISASMFGYDGALQSVVIFEGIRVIERNAFQNCSNLQNVVLPNSVTQIDYSAFGACGTENGFYITLSENLSAVDTSAFSQSRLVEIEIPKSLASINEFMFFGCRELVSVTMYPSVKSIGRSAFSQCDSLQKIRFFGTPEQWESIEMPDDVRDQLTPLVVYVSE